MRIAVFISNTVQSGGGFQYELSVAKILAQFGGDKYDFLFVAIDKSSADTLRQFGYDATHYAEHLPGKLFRHLRRNLFVYRTLNRLGLGAGRLDRFLRRRGVDLVYFASPNAFVADLTRHSFVTTTWDLSHRDMVEFPEVSFDREFENRDVIFKTYLPKAVAVIADSPAGKSSIARRYGVDEERIHVMPFLPSEAMKGDPRAIDITAKYALDGPYVYYPAQFWAHKNHTYILEALARLRDLHDIRLNALFSGSDKGNLGFVRTMIEKHGLQDQVKYIGFVAAEEIACLYGQALAMVMPTYFGLTNIPPLEAFRAQCPVCYSDLDGLKDQVGDGAFLMNLDDPDSLVGHLLTVLKGGSEVEAKVETGRVIVDAWSDENFWQANEVIFAAYERKSRAWAMPTSDVTASRPDGA